jgi:adenylyltransferase/sulfurtransferase
VGLAGQEKIKRASVLVVGAGGLGSPVIQYLSSTGIGKIGIADDDKVDLTNLQRQVIFNMEDIDNSKAEMASKWVRKMNPKVDVQYYDQTIGEKNGEEICQEYDIICDCTDNFKSRYILNDVAYKQGKPYIYGSILGFEGQVGVFNRTSTSPSYRDLVPSPPPAGLMPSCVENGVLGVLPGIIGTLQATEIIKIVLDKGKILDGKILMYNALDMTFRRLTVAKTGNNELIEEEDREKEIRKIRRQNLMSPKEVERLLRTSNQVLLIDVRKAEETNICKINGAKNYPSEQIMNNKNLQKQIIEEAKDKELILYCKSGFRSEKCLRKLLEYREDIYSLEGGIIQWIEKVDNNQARY